MTDTNIVYPPSCRPVTENLGADETIRRLKTLAHTLQAMGQDEGAYQQYIPLALHLASSHFLYHQSRDVQLLIACCIADVLRVYAPEAPYKDPEQIKTIFTFLIRQLGGLKDPKDPAFKRYFYLLENLAYVKSFNMCFDLEDCQEIFRQLFQLMFKIVNDEHSTKVKSFMLDVLCPLITESDSVSFELLDVILINIVEPNKKDRKHAYQLARELIVKTSSTLEHYILSFFNAELILCNSDKKLSISEKSYDLIRELHHISPSIVSTILPQLECKLKSTNDQDRLQAVKLLIVMFCEKESKLAKQHPTLWRAIIGRYNDISAPIRLECVQHSMHFLLDHPELRKEVTDALRLRQHDSDENVRYEVVKTIVSTARKDFELVSCSEDLLEFVKERCLDKKFKIRKEAMTGLAMIYKKHLNDQGIPQATKKTVTWIKDKILHGYYMVTLEDRLMVERLLNTSLVPFDLPVKERMQKLYYLLGTIDDYAWKAFVELQKNQFNVRRCVQEYIEALKKPGVTQQDLLGKTSLLSKHLSDPVKSYEYLNKFSINLLRDPSLLADLETIVRPTVSCKECADTISAVLKKLGPPVMTNLFYNTVKMLLERVSSVLVDHEAVLVLIDYVEDCLRGGNTIEEVGLNFGSACDRGLRLLAMLSFVFPSHFFHEDVLTRLVQLLKITDDSIAPMVLSILVFLGKNKPLYQFVPELMEELAPVCETYACSGTPKQAKNAIRCLHINIDRPEKSKLFARILETIKKNLEDYDGPNYRTAIVALGHLAYNEPEEYTHAIKAIVSRRIVKNLLVKETSDSRDSCFTDSDWCKKSELPDDTLHKIEGMKAMARWLLGLKSDTESARKTFRMLSAYIENKGNLLQSGRMSRAEMSWLRLTAGCAMLKICEQKDVGDVYTASQFYLLSQLLRDDVIQVRDRMATKLHKGLSRGMPLKCLPLDFMGFYALCGTEPDTKLRAIMQNYMTQDVVKRRECIKNIKSQPQSDNARIGQILPDQMLIFSVPILAHDPQFTKFDDSEQLGRMRQCLWFVLEPLVSKPEYYNFAYYKSVIDKMKLHKDSLHPEDDTINFKIWALCDLALCLIFTKTSNFDIKELSVETSIPTLYFEPQPPNFINSRVFLPPEFQYQPAKITGVTLAMADREKEMKKLKKRPKQPERCGAQGTDITPPDAAESQIKIPVFVDEEPLVKKQRSAP